MEYIILIGITLAISLISSTFSYFARRFSHALVFMPPFILLAFAGYTFLLAQRTSDLSGLAYVIFAIVFTLSGIINLGVATVLYIKRDR
jgi:uncharacterized membrane protein YciS (DUF1049 family)